MAFTLVFDEMMIKQLRQAANDGRTKAVLTRMLDRLEEQGPRAGQLLDSRLFLYEMKSHSPPIRLYYRHDHHVGEIKVFEFEMKTSPGRQRQTIDKIRKKVRSRDPSA